MAANVRIQPETYSALRDLAKQANESLGDTLAKAVEAYRRQKLLDDINRSFAALRANPKAWAAEVAERKEWEATLGDGLEDS